MQKGLSRVVVIVILSILYFGGAGLFQYFVLQPILNHFLKAGKQHGDEAINQSMYIYKAMIALIYIIFMRNYCRKTRVVSETAESSTDPE